jgi:DNA-binding IclR family transcriptional regulator
VLAVGRDPLQLAAAPVCAELRDQTGETVMLSVPEGDHVVIVGQWEGTGELRVVQAEGIRAPMVGAATGKAFLAHTGPHVRARILARAPNAKTRVPIDPRGLEHEIEMVRLRGWAVVDGEWLDGIAQVGAAIVVDGQPIGGVGIGLPAHRFGPDVSRRLGQAVSAAAQEIAERVSVDRHVAP